MVNFICLIILILWFIFLILKINNIKIMFFIKKNANTACVIISTIIILYFFPMVCFKIFEFLFGNKIGQIDSYAFSVLAFLVFFISVFIRFILSLLYSIISVIRQNIIYKFINAYYIYITLFIPIIDYLFFRYFLNYISIYSFVKETFLYYIILFSFTIIYLPFFIVISVRKIIDYIQDKERMERM